MSLSCRLLSPTIPQGRGSSPCISPPPFRGACRSSHSSKVMDVAVTYSSRKYATRQRNHRCATKMQLITPAMDRVIAAVSYTLPFFNGLQYGRYLIAKFPKLDLLLQPLMPVITTYKSVPFATFAAFFGLYLGVVRNPSFNYFVRLNAMQALVLDVLLVLPGIIQRIFSPRSNFGITLLVLAYNALFVFLFAGFVYAFVCCILGKTPKIPYIADAAAAQL